MPLRDHFRTPPRDPTSWWESFFGGWPTICLQTLNRSLPPHYAGAPLICDSPHVPAAYEYELKVYHHENGRHLVAAIEFVTEANKDTPERRWTFGAKCAALLQNHISVTIIDLVTSHAGNLYQDLLDVIGKRDASLADAPPPLYAVTCRGTTKGERTFLEAWVKELTLGQPLPTIPVWLADNLAVPLDLESSYEETCRILRIP